MAKALVIGVGGFVGPYLVQHLQQCGYDVLATKMPGEAVVLDGVQLADLDVLESANVEELIASWQPEHIYHLAAVSSVGKSWQKPELTLDVNIKGCLHVLEAVRRLSKFPRIMLVGSSEEYGPPPDGTVCVDESIPPNPQNIYAVSKNTQNALGSLYHRAYALPVISTRSFNHIGPGQSPGFVVSDFCKQVAEIEKGEASCIRVGNLAAKRDFTDVRDVVRAYELLIKNGIPGQTYNVGSGCAVSIQEILDTILSFSHKEIVVEIDSSKLRPVDIPLMQANIQKLQDITGWKPHYTLEQTLRDVLSYWRAQIAG